jgi:hypothetical protein
LLLLLQQARPLQHKLAHVEGGQQRPQLILVSCYVLHGILLQKIAIVFIDLQHNRHGQTCKRLAASAPEQFMCACCNAMDVANMPIPIQADLQKYLQALQNSVSLQ